MNELKEKYNKEIAPALMKEFGLKNTFEVPKINKIHINVGIGSYLKNSKDYSYIIENIELITGQKPVLRKAKKSISNFNKLREGDPNGITVTLRKEKMYDFLYKLINIVAPRIRDFRGFPDKSFDNNGNYSLGLKEHTIFPEIKLDDMVKSHGIEITIVTNVNSKEKTKALLEKFNFPFKKKAN
jgi:large subunit ribosomal protein L5